MFIQIFKLRQTYKDIKDAKNNPRDFAFSQGKGLFIGLALPFLIPGVFFIILSAIFGFTDFLGGPYDFAKILFWIFLVPTVVIFLVLRKIFFVLQKTSSTIFKDKNVSATYDESGNRID